MLHYAFTNKEGRNIHKDFAFTEFFKHALASPKRIGFGYYAQMAMLLLIVTVLTVGVGFLIYFIVAFGERTDALPEILIKLLINLRIFIAMFGVPFLTWIILSVIYFVTYIAEQEERKAFKDTFLGYKAHFWTIIKIGLILTVLVAIARFPVGSSVLYDVFFAAVGMFILFFYFFFLHGIYSGNRKVKAGIIFAIKMFKAGYWKQYLSLLLLVFILIILVALLYIPFQLVQFYVSPALGSVLIMLSVVCLYSCICGGFNYCLRADAEPTTK